MTRPSILHIFIIATFSFTLLDWSAQGSRFQNVGDLLNVACSSRFSSSGSSLRWMILFSSKKPLPQAIIAAVKCMECDYETRTIESLPQWNASGLLPHIDYKVIAVDLSIGDLRRGLEVHVRAYLHRNCQGALYSKDSRPLPRRLYFTVSPQTSRRPVVHFLA